MCIIVIKEKGVDLPKDYIFENCFENNDDGAGFMYNKNGEVIIQKGYMSYKAFKKALDKALKKIDDVKNTAMVFHFRISTQGGTNPQNCHPFPLSSDENDLQATYIKTPLGVAHNGIISLTSNGYSSYYYGGKVTKLKDDHLSDTQIFIRDYLSLIFDLNPNFYWENAGLELVEMLIDSKMCFLDGGGNVETVGAFIEEKGILYSNSTYSYKKAAILPYSSKSTKTKSKNKDCLWNRSSYYDDDYDYDYDYSSGYGYGYDYKSIMPIRVDAISDNYGLIEKDCYGLDCKGNLYLMDEGDHSAGLVASNENNDLFIYDMNDESLTKEIKFSYDDSIFCKIINLFEV